MHPSIIRRFCFEKPGMALCQVATSPLLWVLAPCARHF